MPSRPGRAGPRPGMARGRAARDRHPGWRDTALECRARRPRHAHLHLGHHGRAQGRDAHPRQHHLERDGEPASLIELRADRRVPLLPAALAHLRAHGRALPCSTRVRSSPTRRASTPSPRDMRRCRPTLMASVPRLYEKIYARVLENALAGSPRQAADLLLGPARSARPGSTARSRGEPVPASLALQHRAGRPAGVLEAAGAHRRPAPLLRLGRRAARGRDHRVLLRGRPADPRGLRPHRDLAGDRRNAFEHLRLGTVGRPLPGVEVKIAADGEILTRGPARDEGLLQQAGGDRGSDRPGRLVPHRRHRRARRDGFLAHHRPQEGHHRHRRRQEHRAAADREHGQDEQVRVATP